MGFLNKLFNKNDESENERVCQEINIDESFGILFWGCEIPIICQGEDRPILSEDYIKNVLLPIVNKQK